MRTDPPEPWLLRGRLAVGARMRSLRVRADLSQERLGEVIGVDRKTINRFENGVHAPTVDHIHAIARALGVPPAWLFADDWSTSPGGGSGGGERPS